MKIDANAGASRGRSRTRDTKYRRSGRVARIPRTTYFLFPLPRVGVSSEEDSRRRGTGLSHVYCSEEIGDAAPGNLPVDLSVEELRCRRPRGWNEETTKTRRTCSQREKKEKREKKRKKRERKRCGRLYFLKHDGRRYPQARDNIARLPSSTTAKLDESTPRLRVWWWINEE